MTAPPHIAIIGEAMLELSGSSATPALGHSVTLGQGGDTLNTAIGLARQGLRVDYITALGQDAWSDALVAAWQAETIDTRFVLRHPERRPGLYAIRTDAQGERQFDYWRSQSAARAMFDLPGMTAALKAAADADWLFLSGITLSILPLAAHARLHDLAREVRARGGRVAFDPNYRPAGWPDPEAARAAFDAFGRLCDIALPTRSDEDALHPGLDLAGHLDRWRGLDVPGIVLKDGAEGCHWLDQDGTRHHQPAIAQQHLVDTTGAGDAFNAGCLGALAQGSTWADALAAGCRLASHALTHHGAIAPRASR